MAKLSREEKIQRIALLEEKARREKAAKPSYKPNQGQLEVHLSDKINRFVLSGNGAGKSTLLIHELIWACLGYNPILKTTTHVPCRAFLVLDSPSKLDNVIIPEMRKWFNIKPEQLHKRGKPYVSEISFDNGSTVKMIFWEQNPLIAEGFEGDFFVYDEPSPKSLFISLKRAGRTKGRQARYLLCGTPIAAPWIRTDIYDPWSKGELTDTECFRFATEVNRSHLADGYIEQFSAVMSEKEKGIRLRGEFFDLDGLALSHLFRRETHTIRRDQLDWDRQNPCVIVVDPHPHKAQHAIILGADRDNQLYVLEEYKEKAVARDFTKRLIGLGWFSKYRIMDIVYDSLGSSEMTSGEGFLPFGTVMNEVLSKHGLGRARATTFQEKEDEAFISRIQDALLLPEVPDNFGRRLPKLRFVSDCIGSISNIENVQWSHDKRNDTNKPHLDISNQDFLSCLKYGLATNLYYKKSKDKVYHISKKVYGVDLGDRAKKQIIKSRINKARPKTEPDKDGWGDW